VKKLVHTMEEN